MSLDKLKDAVQQELNKLGKKIGSLKKDIEKLIRDKSKAEDDLKEALIRKLNANKDATQAVKKSNELNLGIRDLRNTKNAIEKETNKLVKDAEDREVKLTADEDAIAKVKAETSEANQEAKAKVQNTVGLENQLKKQIADVEEVKSSYLSKDRIIDDKMQEREELVDDAKKELEDAKKKNKEADEAKVDVGIILKEAKAEKDKHESLVKGLERKGQEKNSLIAKSQSIIKNLQDRELKVKQAESVNESTAKSLKVERNRVALKEAKVKKILDTLLGEKKIEDQLKELGLK